MIKSKTLLGLTAALAVSLSTWTHAATVIVASPTAPTTGPNDIVNFNSSGTLNSFGNTDYSDNYQNGNGAPGQTFTTTTAATLDSVTVKGGSSAGNGYFAATFVLNIYSVSGTTLTDIGSQYFTFADQSGATDYSPDYLTLNLTTPLALSASTQYAFSFGQYASGGGGYYGFAVSPGDVYGGGTAFGAQGQNNLGTDASTANYYSYDRTFAIGLSEAPEPSTWAMMFGGVAMLLGMLRFRRRTL